MNLRQRFGLAARVAGNILTRGSVSLSDNAGWQSLFSGASSSSRFYSLAVCQNAMVLSEYWAQGVRAIAEAVAMATPRLQLIGSKEAITNPGDPAVKLLKQPNPRESFAEFMERGTYYLYNTGEIRIYSTQKAIAGNPLIIEHLRPERLSYDPDDQMAVKLWRYITPSGRMESIKPDELFSTLFCDPASDTRGLSMARVLARTLDAEVEMYEWLAAFFKNGAHMGGFLVSGKARDLELEALMKAQFDEAYSGSRNAHKTAMLWDGLDYKERTTNGPKEADFSETNKRLRERIHGLLKVPPIKTGIVENANRSNSDAQERSFQLDTINPLLVKYAALWTKIVQKVNPRYEVVYPKAVLRDDDVQSQIAARFFTSAGLTPNEVREDYLGKEPMDKPGMDETYMPVSMIPVSMADEPRASAVDPAAASGPVVAPQLDPTGKGGAAASRATFRPVGARQTDQP